MAHDVFISYSKRDKTTADAVCAVLESEGVRCWIAPRDAMPGMEWSECIMEAIEQSRVMVLVFTADANDSPQIRREVERALNQGVAVLTVRIENVMPGRALGYFIGNVHWLDAMTPPLEAHLKNLAETVKALLARMDLRKPVPVPLTPADVPHPVSSPGPSATWPVEPAFARPPAEPVVAQYAEPAFVPPGGPVEVRSPEAPLAEFSRAMPATDGVQAPGPEATSVASLLELAPRTAGPVAAVPVLATKKPASNGMATEASGPHGHSSVAAGLPDSAKGHFKGSIPDSGRATVSTPKPRRARVWLLGGAVALALALVLMAISNFAVRSKISPGPAGSPSQGARPGATPQELAGEANRLILQKRYSEAKPLAEQACDGGAADGCDNLGLLYEHGWGVSRDYAQARSFYEKACDGGSAIGCSNLGVLNENGLGVARDYAQAASLFKKACDSGSAYGCGNLGWMYQNGRGVAQDYGQAASLYEKACDGGDANSCGSLGNLYVKGLGVTQDAARGGSLLQKSCSGGNRWSCDQLKQLQ